MHVASVACAHATVMNTLQLVHVCLVLAAHARCLFAAHARDRYHDHEENAAAHAHGRFDTLPNPRKNVHIYYKELAFIHIGKNGGGSVMHALTNMSIANCTHAYHPHGTLGQVAHDGQCMASACLFGLQLKRRNVAPCMQQHPRAYTSACNDV